MATPLLKMMDVLCTRGLLGGCSAEARVRPRLLELVKGEGRQCSDVARLCAVATALCHLASEGEAADVRGALQVRAL